jgi:hypothetical protein
MKITEVRLEAGGWRLEQEAKFRTSLLTDKLFYSKVYVTQKP